MSKTTLIMVFAGNCGACKVFKSQYLSGLRDALRSFDSVVEINLPKMGRIPEEYPVDINGFVRSYPAFILVSTKKYNLALSKPEQSGIIDKALVYGFYLGDDGVYNMISNSIPTAKQVEDWVRANAEFDSETSPPRDAPRQVAIEYTHKPEQRDMGGICTYRKLSKR